MTWNRCFLAKESTWRNLQPALKFWKEWKAFFWSIFPNKTIQYAVRGKNVIWKIKANWCRIQIGQFLFYLLSFLNKSAKKSESQMKYTSWAKNGLILLAIQALISSANEVIHLFLKFSPKPFTQNDGNIFQFGSLLF